MSETVEIFQTRLAHNRRFARPLMILAAPRLQAYGYTLAAVYAVLFTLMYKAGVWPVDAQGVPVYTDFMNFWFAGLQALHGETTALYDPETITKIQQALVGAGHYVYSIWPYPPTFFLVLAP